MNDDKNLNTTDIDVDKNYENEFVNQDTNEFDETNQKLENIEPEKVNSTEDITNNNIKNNTPSTLSKPEEKPEFIKQPIRRTIRNVGNSVIKATTVKPGTINIGNNLYQNGTGSASYFQGPTGSDTMSGGKAEERLKPKTITAGETAEKTGDNYSKVSKSPLIRPRKPVPPVSRRKTRINKSAAKSKETIKKGTDLNKDKKKLSRGNKIRRHNGLSSLSKLSNLSNLKNRLNSTNDLNGKRKTTDNDKKTKKIEIKSPKKRIIIIAIILGAILSIVFLLLFIVFITGIFGGGFLGSGISGTSGYYPIECEDVTVILVDDNYQVIGNATYPLDEYVAGVINNEVGMFGNLEVYKQFAIAARTFFLRNQDNCTLEASDRRQTFSEVTESTPNGDLMKQAAEETKGMVLLDENDMLINSEYDAFCSIGVDNNYYTIKQQNQKIPKNWVDSQRGIAEEWKQGDCSGNHGRGMSQWGSYYLATEEDYTYEELIEYYLGTEKVSISSKGFISSVAGLEIKDTNNASYKLDQPLSSFLQSKGSSLATYNNFIKESVKSVGAGTREGVVAAAVSSINYLYDNFNTKLPYYWGGHHSGSIGIPERFGYNSPSTPSPSGKRYPYVSFDCSGFVNWAIENGGYNFANTNSYSDSGRFDSCNITDSSCKGQPGDLIDSPSHVVMIVSVDEANNNYYVAESTVSGVIMQTRGMHTNWGETTKIVKMDSFYNNKSNINSNY